MLASVLFRGPGRPGRPKVGPAVDFGRYRPRPRPQGRIIHEAGEAEASGPGPPGTTKIYKVGPLWAPKLFSRHVNVCLFMSLFAPNLSLIHISEPTRPY